MSLAPLILVVGPSGAGKDALMNGARERLADGGRFHFAQRVVTRPASAGSEDHESASPAEFHARKEAGDFLLWWGAHGLAYGIPRAVENHRRDGVAVVANASRGVIESARRDIAPVGVVVVTAPPAVLAARLCDRGRETAADIHNRLHRIVPMVDDEGVRTVMNDASLDEGIARFVAALEELREQLG